MNKIARLCLLVWIFGIFTQVCVAADDDQRPFDVKEIRRLFLPLEERVSALEERFGARAVPRPIDEYIIIPEIAKGYEDVYISDSLEGL